MFVSLDELLAQSDVISVLCPLNAATRNLLSYPVRRAVAPPASPLALALC